MTEWTDGYRAALEDLNRLALSRAVMSVPLARLISDMRQDATEIEEGGTASDEPNAH